jgi:putative redox protein
MTSELTGMAVRQDGMHFVVTAGDHALSVDYPLGPDHACEGPKPLELLLCSLAGCGGGTMVAILSRLNQPIEGLEVNVRGLRRDEHPTILTAIDIEFVVRGSRVDPDVVARALAQAEERLCPVWAMLKDGTVITSCFRMVEE